MSADIHMGYRRKKNQVLKWIDVYANMAFSAENTTRGGTVSLQAREIHLKFWASEYNQFW